MKAHALTPEGIIRKAGNLHSPSPTVIRLLNLLNRPEADYDEVIAVVERDVALSAKLLAVCNSASFGLTQPVSSIAHGVLYLGYGEIHRLLMALSFGGQINAELRGYDMEAGDLWRHSLITGLLTPSVMAVARKCGAEASIAYTAGLLHDIGKMVLSQFVDEATRHEIHHFVTTRGASLLEAEKNVLGCDHAELGACLLHHWHLPNIIVDAVGRHHNPPNDGSANLAAVVHVADSLAHQSGASPGWESFAVVRHERAVQVLDLSPAALDGLMIAAVDCRKKVEDQSAVSVGAPHGPAKAPEHAGAF